MDKTRLPNNMCLVYEYMDKHKSRIITIDQFIWRGFGKDIAEALDMQVGSVYNLIAKLVELGCISRIRHGGTNTPSLYKLIKEPDGFEYTLLKEQAVGSRAKSPTKNERIQDSLNRLSNRVTELERQFKELEVKYTQLKIDLRSQ